MRRRRSMMRLAAAGLTAMLTAHSGAAVPRAEHPDAGLVALYEEAWAEARVRTWEAPEGAPVRRYMDENVYPDYIWVWDSCFMAQFTKYAAAEYPGIETLEALYVPLVEGRDSPLKIWHPDNPPLFAWCELVHWRFHGDRERLEDVLVRRRLLQRHYAWFDDPPTGTVPPACGKPVALRRATAGNGAEGWVWNGVSSGMDNTPRGRGCGGYGGILWIDAIAQQALSARCIADLLEDLGRHGEAAAWRDRFAALAEEINTHYWDEKDGFYYDIAVKDGSPCRVRTLASFWPLLAGVAPRERAERMIAYLRDPGEFGGERPFPTLARSDPDYNGATGDYWRGGIWLPTAYMTVRALVRYGERDLADTLARRLTEQMERTFRGTEPHTIWECYAPEADAPGTEGGRRARPCFCGWSALGPINLFLEHVIGLREVRAADRTVVWDPPADARFPMGVTDLTFGPLTVSLRCDGRILEVRADGPVTVVYRGRRFAAGAGENRFEADGWDITADGVRH